MKQYEVFELQLVGEVLDGDYAEIPLFAEFRHDGKVKIVKGFYDGEGRYIVRFLPEKTGEYSWKVTGAVNAEGHETCEAADGVHHGLVKAVDTHFEYEDGKLFQPFGTTVYALPLPEDKYYRVELIDVWNMIRTVLNENAFGTTKLCLPGKEGLAVLATRID